MYKLKGNDVKKLVKSQQHDNDKIYNVEYNYNHNSIKINNVIFDELTRKLSNEELIEFKNDTLELLVKYNIKGA